MGFRQLPTVVCGRRGVVRDEAGEIGGGVESLCSSRIFRWRDEYLRVTWTCNLETDGCK